MFWRGHAYCIKYILFKLRNFSKCCRMTNYKRGQLELWNTRMWRKEIVLSKETQVFALTAGRTGRILLTSELAFLPGLGASTKGPFASFTAALTTQTAFQNQAVGSGWASLWGQLGPAGLCPRIAHHFTFHSFPGWWMLRVFCPCPRIILYANIPLS